MMVDEATWKRRFAMLMLARFAGLAVFLLGVAVTYSDLLREGGWPQLGAIIIIAGLIDALFAPRLLKKMWERQ
ncbi:MAG TPA: hypothetical protein VM265_03350 [Sphingomicrobium sp.]|nr:hypothetical protein [Sphingomicrobium sp.]